ncbi:aspartyl protease family protein [Niveispirillum sp.]|uniref:aspartyl protease family protein n=1 Tax=Niveispirillum sp. TaxID=1917217 RepID=UPI001B517089|nr:aspartyl protease family protein [Niveispirillum sp.]MBP7338306.1 aspartyl protease family protein [Niveispirillum sp.]
MTRTVPRIRGLTRRLAGAAALLLLGSAPALAEMSPPPPPQPPGPIYAIPTRPDRAGRVLAPVVVDGYGPVRFLVDTGCSGTMIGMDIARALGFTAPPAIPGMAVGADVTVTGNLMRVHDVLGPMIMPTMKVGRIDMGRFVATDMVTPVLSFGDMSGAGGVLGTNSLQGKRLSVNFRRDEIKIEQSRRYAPTGYDSVKGRVHATGLVIVPLEIGGMIVNGLVDTGAERSMFNPVLLEALKERGKPASLVGQIEVVNLAGETRIGQVFLLPRVRIGPISISGLPATLVDAHAYTALGLEDEPAFILGMDVLGISDGFAIDFGTGSLHVRMRVAASGAPPGPSRLGDRGTRGGS